MDSLYIDYTQLPLIKLQVKQNKCWLLLDCQREILCQMFKNKQAEKFLYFINNIDVAARDCAVHQTLK